MVLINKIAPRSGPIFILRFSSLLKASIAPSNSTATESARLGVVWASVGEGSLTVGKSLYEKGGGTAPVR